MEQTDRARLEVACLEAGASEFSAEVIVRKLGERRAGEQAAMTIVLVGARNIMRVEPGPTLPEQGETVQFSWPGSKWQLLVHHAAYGNGRVLMLGIQGSGAKAEHWVPAPPALVMGTVAPEVDPYTVPDDGWGGPWYQQDDRLPPGQAEPVTVSSMAEFEEKFGLLPYGSLPAPEFVPLSVREGGYGAGLRWRVKRGRTRLALWLAPWLGGGDRGE